MLVAKLPFVHMVNCALGNSHCGPQCQPACASSWADICMWPMTCVKCCPSSAEARGGLHIVEQSLWAAVPAYMRKLNSALKKHTDRELPIGCTPLIFGSWMGGDRDGNPNVTAQVSPSCFCYTTLDIKSQVDRLPGCLHAISPSLL